ncbi:MAG: 4-hydroxy-tetrahydrodipicolinate reductase [Alphaproteobacteria bacterium]|nr:4-hydroxy-tetrahydrodipicolinate reductase [Alphaproteobacteria bacterium]
MAVGIAGCTGRVGSILVEELLSGHWEGLTLAGGSVKTGFPHPDGPYFVTERADELFDVSDLVIDFTTPAATAQHLWQAAKHHKPLIVATTGLSKQQQDELQDAAREAPILYSANMSLGVNLLAALVEQAAARLGPDWDIEILETHHKHKIDAPSGTALALGKAAAAGRRVDMDSYAVLDRTGERKEGTIGFAVMRGGDVAGEHTVGFFEEKERLELTHRATDRAILSRGALRAAQWLGRQSSGLYTMRDVLEL